MAELLESELWACSPIDLDAVSPCESVCDSFCVLEEEDSSLLRTVHPAESEFSVRTPSA